MPDTGIGATVDVDRLAGLVAEQLAQRMARLLPDDLTEFWIALVEQTAAERRRAVALAGIGHPRKDNEIKDALAGILPNGGYSELADDGDTATAPLDPDTGHGTAGALGRG